MSGVQSASTIVHPRKSLAGTVRKWVKAAAFSLAVSGLASAATRQAAPQYQAETRILIDIADGYPNSGTGSGRALPGSAGIASQVAVISSNDIVKRVAAKLDLQAKAEFDEAASMSALGYLLVMTGLKADPNEIPVEERVLKRFREKLTVYPVGNSRFIAIAFSSSDPILAAEVPNALADAYIAANRDAKAAPDNDATEWLAPEIVDLTGKLKDTEQKISNLGSQSALPGQLLQVRANRAAAEASAEEVRAVLRNGGLLDAIPVVLLSDLIRGLRERQLQLRAEIADLSAGLVDNHPRLQAARLKLANVDGQVRNEAQRVLNALVSEAQTAQMRERQLIADLNAEQAKSGAGGEAAGLEALEREAEAQRELLDSYLVRYNEASSRRERSYLPSDARVSSRAVAPAEPYFPKVLPITGATFAASLLIMAALTLLRNLFSRRAMRSAPGLRIEPVTQLAMPARPDDPAMGPQSVGSAALTSEASFETAFRPETPSSTLGEIDIRSAARKLLAGGAGRAVFVSPEGDEAAAVAVLVAREVADAGRRVLLLDLTASGAASRPMLESASFAGITNLLASEAQFSDVIHRDVYSDCHVIPVGTANPAQAMRAVERLPIVMQSLTSAYEVVVVECGPADADAIRRLVSDGSELMVSVIEPMNASVRQAAEQLTAGGYPEFVLVTPGGRDTSLAPIEDRWAA